jgi:hypothetical protein
MSKKTAKEREVDARAEKRHTRADVSPAGGAHAGKSHKAKPAAGGQVIASGSSAGSRAGLRAWAREHQGFETSGPLLEAVTIDLSSPHVTPERRGAERVAVAQHEERRGLPVEEALAHAEERDLAALRLAVECLVVQDAENLLHRTMRLAQQETALEQDSRLRLSTGDDDGEEPCALRPALVETSQFTTGVMNIVERPEWVDRIY